MALSLRKLIPQAVRSDLKKVERRLSEAIRSDCTELFDPAATTLTAGGKRLRPALVLLCSYTGSKSSAELIDVACAVELIHMGSLVHDDIVDENPARRGKVTVASSGGDHLAVCVGDFLFARAFKLLSGCSDQRISQVIATAVCEMGSGELEQLDKVNSTDAGIDAYLEKTRKKTAVLFAASCEIGGMCAGLQDPELVALRSYGEQLGMAFQVYDDILDFTATEDELGKPPGTDLKEGNVTLPMIYALEDGGDLVAKAIGSKDGRDIEGGIQAVLSGTAIARTKRHAISMVQEAKSQASRVSSDSLRSNLAALADYVVERVN